MLAETNGQTALVLDTSAFVAGFDPLSIEDLQFSVPEVRDELIRNTLPWIRFRTAVEKGKLKVKAPKPEFLGRVKAEAKATGDFLFLSNADKQVLALSLELRAGGSNPQVVTDDYSMQNVVSLLQIQFVPLMTFGIRYRLSWMLYCPACYSKYPGDYGDKYCKICGTELKRKPVGRKPIRANSQK
ncbi:MAG: ribonuclease VapC [Candidatus Bathyarchaeota archaeon]|nr:ribonuclease VapC [Candidatus Bathyarchaeota archaeon]